MAAAKSLTLNIGDLLLLARVPARIQNNGRSDPGLSLVSPRIAVTGRLSVNPSPRGDQCAYMNTSDGILSGKNNQAASPALRISADTNLHEQFETSDSRGFALQPVARVATPPPAPPVDDTDAFPPEVYDGFQNRISPLQPASLAVDEGLSPRGSEQARRFGIWVHHSLELNGRWPATAEAPNEFSFSDTRFRNPR